jgi:hypothetical protein
MLVDQTQLVKKRKKSEALASCIKRTRFEMFPCSRYDKRNFKYVVSNKENSGRCLECVCYKVSYNVKGILISK